MKTRLARILLISSLLLPVAGAADRSAKNPIRVVCFGDSITKRGYPALLGKNLGVDVINAGVAGNSSAAGLRRMNKDVIAQKPDVTVIFFGTNDARVDEPKVHVTPKQYAANLLEMIDACEKAGSKVVICTLPPINEEAYFKRHETKEYAAAGGIPKLWEQYRQAALQVAEKKHLPVVDLNKELLKDPKWLSPDGVHPAEAGSQLIAQLIGKEVAPLLPK